LLREITPDGRREYLRQRPNQGQMMLEREFSIPVPLAQAAEILRAAAHRHGLAICTVAPDTVRVSDGAWLVLSVTCSLFSDDRASGQRTIVRCQSVASGISHLLGWNRFVETCKRLAQAETTPTLLQSEIQPLSSSEDSGIEKKLTREYLTQLLQVLDKHLNEDELKTLCFHLDVDYDDLPSEGKANKARELIEYLGRRDRILELVQTGKRLRRDIPWPEVVNGT